MPTIVARFLNGGVGATLPVVFRPVAGPTLVGEVFQEGGPITVLPDSQGGISVSLLPGVYLVDNGVDRPFPITVPNTSLTYSLRALAGNGAAIAQSVNPVTPNFRWEYGQLLLSSITDGGWYALGLADGGLFQLTSPQQPGIAASWPAAQPAPVTGATTGQACLQLLSSPSGLWKTIWLSGTGPALNVGDATTSAAQAFRLGTDSLQLPNLGLGGYHSLLVVGTQSGPALAFGANTP
jgi:hypothetical protein